MGVDAFLEVGGGFLKLDDWSGAELGRGDETGSLSVKPHSPLPDPPGDVSAAFLKFCLLVLTSPKCLHRAVVRGRAGECGDDGSLSDLLITR